MFDDNVLCVLKWGTFNITIMPWHKEISQSQIYISLYTVYYIAYKNVGNKICCIIAVCYCNNQSMARKNIAFKVQEKPN